MTHRAQTEGIRRERLPFPMTLETADATLDVPFPSLIRRLEGRAFARKALRAVRQPPFYLLQQTLAGASMGRISVQRRYFMVLDIDDPRDDHVEPPDGVTFRLASTADLEPLTVAQNALAPDRCHERFALGDSCVVAEHQREIVGYNWFSVRPDFFMDELQYRLVVPPCAAYSFDGFVRREYRRSGVWSRMHRYLADVEVRRVGRRFVIACVDYGNAKSLAAQLRHGFRPFAVLHHTSWFGRTVHRERAWTLAAMDEPFKSQWGARTPAPAAR